MKRTTLSLFLALSTSSIAFAQPNSTQSTDTKNNMGAHKCTGMKRMTGNGMAGMNMNGMDMQKCQEMMNAQGSQHTSNDAGATTHKAVAVVKSADAASGTVTLSHEPIETLKWPAMTMAFAVKDKRLFDKLVVGKKVNVELVKQGGDYVVTAVN